MASPVEEFQARLDEIRSGVRFVSLSSTLRPRLGEGLNWEADRQLLTVARDFIQEKSTRVELLYAGIFVTAVALFERFIRQLVEHHVTEIAKRATSFDEIGEKLAARHLVLTGRVLSSFFEPRDHLSFDFSKMIEVLATCRPGNKQFGLNATAFSSVVTSASPSVVEKALGNIDLANWWDAVGDDSDLQKVLGSSKARRTSDLASERLTELWRWRNQIAHAGDKEVSLSSEDLDSATEFMSVLCVALSKALEKKIPPLKERGFTK